MQVRCRNTLRDAGEMQAYHGFKYNTKAQHRTALLLASAPRAGNAEREERDRSPDITPDELASAGRHLICAT